MDESLDNNQLAMTIEDIGDGETCRKNKAEALTSLKDGFDRGSNPVFGHVAVKNSENVHFGNNTYFNGPVVIKQIIQNSSSGIDNESYVKAQDDATQNKREEKVLKSDESINEFQCKIWHVLMALLGAMAIIGITCSVYFSRYQEESWDNRDEKDDLGQNSNLSVPYIAPSHLRIVERNDWLAQPPTGILNDINQPIPWVVITHTATKSCSTQSECVLRTRLIQDFHIESRKWFDIGYNFLVGGDGSVYVGRGWDYVGAHTLGYNVNSIGIGFIGTFTVEDPPKRQFDACQKLLQLGVKLGKLAKQYKLLAHRQLMSTSSPGDKVFDVIKEWPHFVKDYKEIDTRLAQ